MTEFDFQNPKENILSYIPESIYMYIMPNTSWARNTGEAVWIYTCCKKCR